MAHQLSSSRIKYVGVAVGKRVQAYMCLTYPASFGPRSGKVHWLHPTSLLTSA